MPDLSEPKKPTRCGVSVSTWGTHYDAGNGMLHYMDTNWFGGNVGHASVTVRIPDDDRGRDLIKKYCEDPYIPHKKKTLTVRGLDGKPQKEVVHEIYFSWWPGLKHHELGEFSKDTQTERSGVSFEWDPKWEKYIKPESRRRVGEIGQGVISLGTKSVVHKRGLDEEGLLQFNLKANVQRALSKLDSINVLQKKFADSNNENVEVSFTIKNLLNDFIPDWKNLVKDQKKLSPAEVSAFSDQLKSAQEEIGALGPNLKELYGIKEINGNLLKQLQEVDNGKNVGLNVLLKSLGEDNEKEVRRKILEERRQKASSMKLNKNDTKKFINAAFEKLDKAEIQEVIKIYDEKVKQKEADIVKELGPTVFPEKYDPSESNDEELYLTYGLPPENTVNIPLSDGAFSGIGKKGGLNPEEMLKQMHELTVSPKGFDLETHNCSMTVGSILEAGATTPQDKKIFQSRAFGYFGNPQEVFNSALKVSSNVSSGSRPGVINAILNFNPIERAGGYLIGIWMEERQSKSTDPSKPKRPWYNPLTGKQWLVLPAGIIVAAIATPGFVLRKIVNPLKTFKSALGLMNYVYSKPSAKFFSGTNLLKGITTLFIAPVVVLFAPVAAFQYIAEKGGNRFLQWFKPSPKKQLKIEKEVERSYAMEKFKNRSDFVDRFEQVHEKREELEKFLSRSIKERVVEIGITGKPGVTLALPSKVKEKAIEAFRNLKIFLQDSTQKNRIPIFSKDAEKVIKTFIEKGYELPSDLSRGENGEKLTAEALYQSFCNESLKRTTRQQNSMQSMLTHKKTFNEFSLNNILTNKYEASNTTKPELDFLNNLKEILKQDINFNGREGVSKKSELLLTAIELVMNQLKSEDRLTSKDKEVFEKEMDKLKNIGSKETNGSELEDYLVKVSTNSGDRALVEKCHDLIIQEKHRSAVIRGSQK